MNGFVATPVSENIIATSFKKRAAKIDKFDRSGAGRFIKNESNKRSRRKFIQLLPKKLIAYFQELEPKTTTDDGVLEIAGWRCVLRLRPARKYDERRWHRMKCTILAYARCTRVEAEMRTILDANGFANTPIRPGHGQIDEGPRFLYSNDDKGRADALAE